MQKETKSNLQDEVSRWNAIKPGGKSENRKGQNNNLVSTSAWIQWWPTRSTFSFNFLTRNETDYNKLPLFTTSSSTWLFTTRLAETLASNWWSNWSSGSRSSSEDPPSFLLRNERTRGSASSALVDGISVSRVVPAFIQRLMLLSSKYIQIRTNTRNRFRNASFLQKHMLCFYFSHF